jgi:hypothetical protein
MKKIDLSKIKSLLAFLGKKVQIVTNEDKIYTGVIDDFMHEDDADDGLETIGIDMGNYIECFDRTMIKTIEIEDNDEIPAVYLKERASRSGYTEPTSPMYASGK